MLFLSENNIRKTICPVPVINDPVYFHLNAYLNPQITTEMEDTQVLGAYRQERNFKLRVRIRP